MPLPADTAPCPLRDLGGDGHPGDGSDEERAVYVLAGGSLCVACDGRGWLPVERQRAGEAKRLLVPVAKGGCPMADAYPHLHGKKRERDCKLCGGTGVAWPGGLRRKA